MYIIGTVLKAAMSQALAVSIDGEYVTLEFKGYTQTYVKQREGGALLLDKYSINWRLEQ